MQQLTIGTLLRGGSYKIEKVLGQGSFGITYLAEHTNLGRKVAIKEFFMKELNSRGEDGSITGMTDGSLSQNYCVKFQKEAVNLSRLDHPNIVRVTDSFSENGTFYYVMDYIDGQNLNDYIKSHHVDEVEATSIIKSVADALIYMHEGKHMLHLDLKPGNVMRRNSDGHIFLIDFGLSKHYSEDGQPETSTTIGLGTPGYAPIEQGNRARNGEFRPTIDVYALGATFYKLLTRETPPPASDLVSDDELLENNLRAKGVSDNLAKVVTEAMCPSVKKRTKSIREFKSNMVGIKPTALSTETHDFVGEIINKEETIVTAIVDDDMAEKKSVEYNATTIETNYANNNPDDVIPMKHSIFNFSGRAGRLTYWIASVIGIFALGLPMFVLEEFARTLGLMPNENIVAACVIMLYLVYCWVVLSIGAKRCHDLGHSGWFQMIPFYGFVMLFSSGDCNDNEYGTEDNGISKKSLKVLGIIVAIIYVIMFTICIIGDDKAKQYAEAEDMIEGHIIKDGIVQPGDSVTALPIIQKLADKQYGPAIWMLAQYYENGSAGIPMDTLEANRLCEQAFPILQKEAEKGDMYSQCALSLIYASGKGTQTDNSKAFTWMQKSAEQGYGDALGNLAIHYLNGIGCNENEQKAFEYMQKATEVNKTNGEMLAAMYLQGIGTKIDTTKAIAIYKELADLQLSSSQAQLGHIYYEQDKYDLAFNYLSKAEKKDELQAIDDLTVMYLRGWGVTANQDKAISIAQRGVELSGRDPYFLFALGICYEEKNNAKAFANVKESAEKGNPNAQYRLALYYQNGYGVKVNDNLAYKWYKKALANGYKE